MFGYVKKEKVFDILERELRIYRNLLSEVSTDILEELNKNDAPIVRSKSGDEGIRKAIKEKYTLEIHRYNTLDWPIMKSYIDEYNHCIYGYRAAERTISIMKDGLR